jgi:ATP-dependent Lon protease
MWKHARFANPILLIDEIEKVGTSSHNGRLWDAQVVGSG